MDRVEAIKYLEVKKAEIVSRKHTLFGCNGYDALCSACDALREQEQREQKPITNADRIRAMSDEELARELADIWDCHKCSEYERLAGHPLLREEQCDQKCEQHCLAWLRQPAGGADHE